MTTDEMLDKIQAAIGKPMGFTSSKDGMFLNIDGTKFEVNDEQGAILWDLLPKLAGCRERAVP